MPTIIDGIASNESVSVKWVATIADTAAPKLSTEIDAATSASLECLMTEKFSPDASFDRVSMRRACSATVRERAGSRTRTIADIVAVYDPQAALTTALNAAYKSLAPLALGYLVVRWGKHVDTAWAVGDKVDVYPVEVGYRTKVAGADNEELTFKAGIVIRGDVKEDVAIVA